MKYFIENSIQREYFQTDYTFAQLTEKLQILTQLLMLLNMRTGFYLSLGKVLNSEPVYIAAV